MPSVRPLAAVVGLGMSDFKREPTAPPTALAVVALRRALEDAGLKKDDVDGIVINGNPVHREDDVGLSFAAAAGLRRLRLANVLTAEGSTAAQTVQFAALAVSSGLASVVACVFADTPITSRQKSSGAFGQAFNWTGLQNWGAAYGLFGAPAIYALAARRHMALYGTTHEHFGAVALAARKWAQLSPLATFRHPLTMKDYLDSRWIAEPFRRLDCATPVNGAIVVLVTSADRAPSLKQPAVFIRGFGQAHSAQPMRAGFDSETTSVAGGARDTAFSAAGISLKDIDVCQMYDAFTYVTILLLEDYGFCKKGEGGPFVADGRLAPQGSLPTNTGGGQLSGYYLQGMTPISEGILQARGGAGERQVAKHDMVLVANIGGRLDHHACLILSKHID